MKEIFFKCSTIKGNKKLNSNDNYYTPLYITVTQTRLCALIPNTFSTHTVHRKYTFSQYISSVESTETQIKNI